MKNKILTILAAVLAIAAFSASAVNGDMAITVLGNGTISTVNSGNIIYVPNGFTLDFVSGSTVIGLPVGNLTGNQSITFNATGTATLGLPTSGNLVTTAGAANAVTSANYTGPALTAANGGTGATSLSGNFAVASNVLNLAGNVATLQATVLPATMGGTGASSLSGNFAVAGGVLNSSGNLSLLQGGTIPTGTTATSASSGDGSNLVATDAFVALALNSTSTIGAGALSITTSGNTALQPGANINSPSINFYALNVIPSASAFTRNVTIGSSVGPGAATGSNAILEIYWQGNNTAFATGSGNIGTVLVWNGTVGNRLLGNITFTGNTSGLATLQLTANSTDWNNMANPAQTFANYQTVQNWTQITAYTGGTPGCLDNMPTANMLGQIIHTFVSGRDVEWQIQVGTAASSATVTSPPMTVKAVDNGTTGWEFVQIKSQNYF